MEVRGGFAPTSANEMNMNTMYIIRLFTFLVTMVLGLNMYSQYKQLTVLDKTTHEPIELVNVFYSKFNEGSITNRDGKLRIETRKDTLTFSHINYATLKLNDSSLQVVDSIYLEPIVNTLDEVILYDFDLKQKLEFVSKNYEKLYMESQTTNETTYKEKLKINNRLARLIQVQLSWWQKGYKYDFSMGMDKQCAFILKGIEYSKIPTENASLADGAYLENDFMIPAFYLNYYLLFLHQYTTDIFIDQVLKIRGVTQVIFSAPVVLNDTTLSNLVRSEVAFDNVSGAITYLKFNMQYPDNPKQEFSERRKVYYESATTSLNLELNFKQVFYKKWFLSSFKSNVVGNISYSGKHEAFEMKQELFITKTSKGKNIDKAKIIMLNKPFYENFPSGVTLENNILLTKEELDFVNEN